MNICSPFNHEDLTDSILEGIGDGYKSIVDSVHAHDNPISFVELHEKLLNRETTLSSALLPTPFPYPVTANLAHNRSSNWRPPNNNNSNRRYTNTNQNQHNSKPYLRRCQACGIQGHSVKYCPQFRIVPHTASGSNSHLSGTQHQTPRAYNATTQATATPSWLFDSGASHHITSDLANLYLHSPYSSGEEVQVGNEASLEITHTGFSTLASPNKQFQLEYSSCSSYFSKFDIREAISY